MLWSDKRGSSMEYFIGSMVTLACLISLRFLLKNKGKRVIKVKVSQSYLYELMSDIANREFERSTRQRQSDKYLEKDMTKIMIVEDRAYWIKDNRLHVADYLNGKIDNYSAKEVDTMGMDSVELERTIFVVEKLTEDT
jgi:hypothetical protein